MSVVPDPAAHVLALRWVSLFAFAQAVHYAAWLHLVPDAERAGERPVSFRRSFALLRADLGSIGARAVVALCLVLPICALVWLDGARHFYIGLAVFHGFIELAWITMAVMSRFALRTSDCEAPVEMAVVRS